jgi:hypothetical protein
VEDSAAPAADAVVVVMALDNDNADVDFTIRKTTTATKFILLFRLIVDIVQTFPLSIGVLVLLQSFQVSIITVSTTGVVFLFKMMLVFIQSQDDGWEKKDDGTSGVLMSWFSVVFLVHVV